MHHDPRLGIEERIVRAFLIIGRVVTHGEQIRNRQPCRSAEQRGQRLRRITKLSLIADEIFLPGETQFRVATHLRLLVCKAKTRKIFSKAFIEPSRSWRIVVVQQQVRKLVRYSAPTVVGKQVQHDVIAIVTGKEKARSRNWLVVNKRRELNIFLVTLDCDDLQRFGHSDAGLHEKLREHGAHLLEAQDYFAASFLSGIGENRKMTGADANPRCFSGVGRDRAEKQECWNNAAEHSYAERME